MINQRMAGMMLAGLGLSAGITGCSLGNQSKEKQKPNILLIVSEDNGPDLGCYGNPHVHTPVLDSLAESGVRFENAYVTYSVCSPSRSTIFTGLYPHQNGQIGLATHKYEMFESFKTLPVFMKEAGYRTGCLGKIHVNPESAIPFDFHPIKGSNFGKKNLPRYAKEAAKFVNESSEPFFLMVNFPDAHFPVQRQVQGLPTTIVEPEDLDGALPFVGANSERLREFTANYYNCMNRLDESVGMLMDKLRKAGKLENTLVIYLGDHGAQFARGKCSNYEAGIKVPFMVSWPGKVKSNQVNSDFISSIDILPSILDVAGIQKPENLPGRTFIPLVKGEVKTNDRKYIFADGEGSAPFFYFPRRSVRGERFKLINNLLQDRENPKFRFYQSLKGHFAGGTTAQELAKASDEWKAVYECWRKPPQYELYDLENDPQELHNLSEDPKYGEVLEELKAELAKWQLATNDPLRIKEKLDQLTFEMDSVSHTNLKKEYQKNPDFKWGYVDYLNQ